MVAYLLPFAKRFATQSHTSSKHTGVIEVVSCKDPTHAPLIVYTYSLAGKDNGNVAPISTHSDVYI